MAYYNRNGKILRIKRKGMEYLNSGECASVYHNNEIIFKEYFSETPADCRLKPRIFDILKDIDDEHFMKLLEIYSDMNLLELIQYKTNARNFSVDAYTAIYYNDDSVNVLYESTDYILDNFRELERLFDIFTNNSIITDDVKRENVILSHNGIIIIDPDIFDISSSRNQDIQTANKKELLNLFRSICVSDVGDIENHHEITIKIIRDLTDIDINSKTDITSEISKKLKYVKKPIEYLIK